MGQGCGSGSTLKKEAGSGNKKYSTASTSLLKKLFNIALSSISCLCAAGYLVSMKTVLCFRVSGNSFEQV